MEFRVIDFGLMQLVNLIQEISWSLDQIKVNVQMVLIIVITMRHVLIRMDHLLALVTLDIVETE